MNMAKELRSADFNEFIAQDKAVLIDFWAPWCGPCRMLAPVIDQVSAEMSDVLAVGKVNVDENEDLARQFRVMSIPTLILFKNGKVVDQTLGFMQKAQLEAFVKKAL